MGVLQGWRWCPVCKAELRAPEGRVECPSCGFVAYANPAPTASAVVVDREGRVLLCRRAIEPDKGKWDHPGGFVEEGEHPLDALRRELAEETGLEIEPGEFLGVWMDVYDVPDRAVSTLNLFWAAEIRSGTPSPADDVAELRWFSPGEIPLDELAFDVNRRVLTAWVARDEDA